MPQLEGLKRDGLVWKIFDHFLNQDFNPSEMYLFEQYEEKHADEDKEFKIDVDFFLRKRGKNKIILVQTVESNSEQDYNWAKNKLDFVSDYFFKVPNMNDEPKHKTIPLASKKNGAELVGFRLDNRLRIDPFMAYHAGDGTVGFFDLKKSYKENLAIMNKLK